MIDYLLRIYIFTIIPLMISTGIIIFDKTASSPKRRFEIYLIFLFAVSVAGNGITNFIAHFFLSDIVADAIGWATGSPFQLEVAFANLSIGILGFIAVGRTDGFREATLIAITIFGLGATIVHIMDIIQTNNLAPGNTIQNILNIAKPVLLIFFLVQYRKAGNSQKPDQSAASAGNENWKKILYLMAGITTGMVSTVFAMGYFLKDSGLLTLIFSFILVGFTVIIVVKSHARNSH